MTATASTRTGQEEEMRVRPIATVVVLFTLIAGSSLPAAGQTSYEPPRQADGKPTCRASGTSGR